MKYSFHPDAEAELINAIEYYEGYEKSLGYDFSLEVYLAIERAVSYPQAWPIIEPDIKESFSQKISLWGSLFSRIRRNIYCCCNASA